jgi:hypothetical protein
LANHRTPERDMPIAVVSFCLQESSIISIHTDIFVILTKDQSIFSIIVPEVFALFFQLQAQLSLIFCLVALQNFPSMVKS